MTWQCTNRFRLFVKLSSGLYSLFLFYILHYGGCCICCEMNEAPVILISTKLRVLTHVSIAWFSVLRGVAHVRHTSWRVVFFPSIFAIAIALTTDSSNAKIEASWGDFTKRSISCISCLLTYSVGAESWRLRAWHHRVIMQLRSIVWNFIGHRKKKKTLSFGGEDNYCRVRPSLRSGPAWRQTIDARSRVSGNDNYPRNKRPWTSLCPKRKN